MLFRVEDNRLVPAVSFVSFESCYTFECKKIMDNIPADSAIGHFKIPEGCQTHASVSLFYIVTAMCKLNLKSIAYFIEEIILLKRYSLRK